MNKLNKINSNLKKTIESHQEFAFPEFIQKLRDSMCLSRRTLATDLNCDYLKLFYMENGEFASGWKPETILQMADYFGVDRKLMAEKAIRYIGIKKGTALMEALKNV